MSAPNDLRTLEIILTASCNLRCRYCYQNDKKARSVTWDALRAALDFLLRSRHNPIHLLFVGGEPLLEFPLIQQAVAYVEDTRRPPLAVHYDVITNGLLITDEHIDFFVAHGIDVQLSFDGVPAAQALRGPDTFATLDALLVRLRHEHPDFFRRRLAVSLTLLAETLPSLPDSVAYFLDRGIQTILISPSVTHQPGWRADRLHEMDVAFSRLFDVCLAHYRSTGEQPLVPLRNRGEDPARVTGSIPMCNAASGRKAAIDIDGELVGCVTFARSYQVFPTMFLRDRLESMRMGDVRDPDLESRRASYTAAALETRLFNDKQRKYSSYGRCGECRFLNTCGICPVSIGHQPENTDPDRVPDFLCAYNLILLEHAERFPRAPGKSDLLSRLGHIEQMMTELQRLLPAAAACDSRSCR